MTNPRGTGQNARSRARMGRASVSPAAGASDPRRGRQQRQSMTDFTLGSGLTVDRHGRDRISISQARGNILRMNERGELEVSLPATVSPDAVPSRAPAPLPSVGFSTLAGAEAQVAALVSALTRVHQILAEQRLTDGFTKTGGI